MLLTLAGLWNECANLHLGDPQVADLGDGKGWERELFVMRESVWPFPWVGSCLETITGTPSTSADFEWCSGLTISEANRRQPLSRVQAERDRGQLGRLVPRRLERSRASRSR